MDENTSGLSPEVIEGVFDLARDGLTGPVGEMIDAGVGLDVVNASGDTLLIVAAYQQHAETVGELLRRGADASVVNAMGQTAISCAVFRNNETILRLLLEADADPRLGTHSGVAIADQFGLPRMREIIELYPRD
ncbi:ankyrin repeat domain-containing protein [Cryobacterium aureum]|uniref:ankyrin repeat domain-containing protein n=1 Tax=Cryobacterium aureum TaxID=995037 RepID=UPI00196B2359|nr:ankyrin repeat domain-containing protein [Cryobacterium aureum]